MIEDFLNFEQEVQGRFEEMFDDNTSPPDVVLCSSPAVLCAPFYKYKKIALIGYFGEPILLGVQKSLHTWWFSLLQKMVKRENSFWAVYNPWFTHLMCVF